MIIIFLINYIISKMFFFEALRAALTRKKKFNKKNVGSDTNNDPCDKNIMA
jgi:hypothetical protein